MTKRPVHENAGPPDDGSGSFAAYLEYNRVLRTWFVAFGIGGPVLFLSHQDVATSLANAGKLRLVASLLITGAAAQVIGALINKLANWYNYAASNDDTDRLGYRVAEWLTEQFWIDVVLDVLTIAVYGCALWLLLTVFANNAPSTLAPH